MKILKKNGTSNSSTDSGLTADKLVVILVIVALIFVLIPSVVTAGHWLLSNQPRLVPAD